MPGLASLASGLTSTNDKNSEAALVELDDQDRAILPPTRFQYFPESIQDSKTVNFQTFDIPGASVPIYQWISSGARVISFRATFSTDVNLRISPQVGRPILDRLKDVGQDFRNVDARSALVWLRRFQLPRYGDPTQVGTVLAQAPHKLILVIPGSGIGFAGGYAQSNGTGPDSVLCLLVGCDIAYETFFRNGLPRVVAVDLSFVQIAQRGGTVQFPGVDTRIENSYRGGGQDFHGYTLTSKTQIEDL